MINMFKKIKIVVLVSLVMSSLSAQVSSAENKYVLESTLLRAHFDPQDGGLAIWDKRSDQWYRSVKPEDATTDYKVSVLHHSSMQLSARLMVGGNRFKVHWSFKDDATLTCRIYGDTKQRIAAPGFAYPHPMSMVVKDSYLVVPESGGFLYQADGSTMHPELKKKENLFYEMYKHGHAMMAMVGITDLTQGLVYVFDTPADSGFRLEKFDDPALGSGYAPGVIWRSEKGEWGYARKAYIHVSNEGGFVSLAKFYRRWLIDRGDYKSLREKAKERPKLDQMIGAPHTWITSIKHTRTTNLIDDFKRNGIDKFVIKGNTFGEFPQYHEKGSMVEVNYDAHDAFIKRANSHGYLVGKYMTYSSIRPFEKDEPWSSLFWRFDMLRDDNYLDYSGIMKADGTRMLGWQNQGVRVCERFGMDEIIPEHMNYYKEYFMRHDAMFFDVEGALAHYECYDPDHPMTRSDNVEARKERARYFRDFNPEWVTGTEDGSSDYMLQYYDWIEGPPTSERFSDWKSKRRDKQSPYYMGTWNRDEDRNAPILYQPCLSDPQMTNNSLNPQTRIPLYELVHGDQIVTVCRWEYPNNKMTDVWKLKDLRNMLWGTPPAYGLTGELWEEQKEQLIDSIKTVCSWVEKIAYDEMTDFEYLTEDKFVQKSTFSSGKSIIVNFGNKRFSRGNNHVEPMGYFIIE